MARLTNLFSSLVLLAIAVLGAASCTETVTSTSTNAPSDLTAAATSSSTIVVHWKRDPADVGADTIVVTDTVGTSKMITVVVSAPDTTGTVAGLDTGIQYKISVHSSGGVSSVLIVTTNPPSGLEALSLDSATISVAWIRAQGDASADTIIATSSVGPSVSIPVASPGAGPISIPKLSEGAVYSISIHSTAGFTPPLQWMTAERTRGIKIYETNDTGSIHSSALIFGTHNTHASSLAGLTNADFVLESITDATVPSRISLVSGKVYNPSWTDVTSIDPDSNYIAGGLDFNYRSTDYQADQAKSIGTNSYDIPNDNNEGTSGFNRILIATTSNGNLALVEIVPDTVTFMPYSNDTSRNSSGVPYKYITVNVSYQSVQNQPYAARGRKRNTPSEPVRRVSAH
jgi:hypothetical protein